MSGKLNGAMTETTPAGRRLENDQRGSFEGSTSPFGWLGRLADSKQICVAIVVSRSALGWIAPDSRTIHSPISAACSAQRSPARRSTAAFSAGVVLPHCFWAEAARAAAA